MKPDFFNQKFKLLQNQLNGFLSTPGQPAFVTGAVKEIIAAMEELKSVRRGVHRQNGKPSAAPKSAEAECQHFQNLFEFAPHAYLFTDPTGVIGLANLKARSQLNAELAMLRGKSLADFVAEEDQESFLKKLNSLKKSKQGTAVWETQLQPQSGAPFSAILTVSPIYNAEGKSNGLGWHINDITKSRKLERALEFSHQFLTIANNQMGMNLLLNEFVEELKSFTGCSAIGIHLLDEQGNFSRRVCEGFGREMNATGDPSSVHFDQCICMNVSKGVIDSKVPHYTEGGSFYVNNKIQLLAVLPEKEKSDTSNLDNQERYESIALIPIRLGCRILGLIHLADPEENKVPRDLIEILETVAMHLGTTIQHVLAEEARRGGEKNFREILKEIRLAAVTLDRSGHIVFCNDFLLELTGWRKEEVIGQIWFDLFVLSGDKTIQLFFEGVKEGKIQSHCQGEILTRNGERRWINWNNILLRNSAGKVVGITSVGEDTTEQKRSELPLQESYEKFKVLFEQLPIGVSLVDQDHKISYVNPALEKILPEFCT